MKKVKRRKNRKQEVVESDWRDYTGSNKTLNKDIKKYGKEHFRFEIIRQCKSRGGLYYAEIEEMVMRDVLRTLMDGTSEYLYYNGQIPGCKFRPKVDCCP